MHGLLHDIGLSVLAATVLGLIAHWLRQPIILGYLLAGALVGPVGFKLVHEEHSVEIISEIGLVLLLFIIGLEMNLKALLASGKQLLVTGFGQFPLCVAMGIALFGALGLGMKGQASEGLYFALLCGLSSTAVVVKLLYDKGELDTLPGRMTLGVLVIQDIYAIFILAFQPNFANPSVGPVVKALVGTVGLLVGGFLISKYVLRWVFGSIAKAPEMVVAVSIGWCAAVAVTAAWLGLSKEMGALVAGLCISAFPYSIHVTAKTLPLRDFFLTLFFTSLGMKIAITTAGIIGIAVGLVGFVVLTRFLSVYPLLVLSGAGRRTAFISSLNLSQISEFSLVIAAIGASEALKHIRPETVNVLIYAMAISAVLSSYGIRYNHQIYLAWERLMQKLGRGSSESEAAAHGKHEHPVVILGFHRGGRALIDLLSEQNPEMRGQIMVIDFNPEVLGQLRREGVHGMFGDISSYDTLEHAHLKHAKLIISAIPDMLLKGTDNLTLVKMCRALAPHADIVATADDARHGELLRQEGATHVASPHALQAAFLSKVVVSAVGGERGASTDAGTLVAAGH